MSDILAAARQRVAMPSFQLSSWNALRHDEQARRLREVLAEPACDTITDDSMSDVLAAARGRA
jgi:hypothetical protein